MQMNEIPKTFLAGLSAFFKGEEDLIFPFAILLDKIRPLVGKLPNKADKIHRARLLRLARKKFIKKDHIDMDGIRFPLLNKEDEDLLFNGIMWESLAPYLFEQNSFAGEDHR